MGLVAMNEKILLFAVLMLMISLIAIIVRYNSDSECRNYGSGIIEKLFMNQCKE